MAYKLSCRLQGGALSIQFSPACSWLRRRARAPAREVSKKSRERERERERRRENGRDTERRGGGGTHKHRERERQRESARRRREKRERKEDIPSDSEFLEMRRFGQWIAAVDIFGQYRCSFDSADVSWVNVGQ